MNLALYWKNEEKERDAKGFNQKKKQNWQKIKNIDNG